MERLRDVQSNWVKRGKKYRAKTFDALKQLYQGEGHDKDCQDSSDRSVEKEKGISLDRQPT